MHVCSSYPPLAHPHAAFYRERYTPFSLLVLKVKDVPVPLGDSCPLEVNWPSLSWMVAAFVLLIGCLTVACVSRACYERRTHIVRVLIAALSIWDFITDWYVGHGTQHIHSHAVCVCVS